MVTLDPAVMVKSCHRLVEAFLGMQGDAPPARSDYETDIDDMIESTRSILERHCTDEKVSNWWFWRKR